MKSNNITIEKNVTFGYAQGASLLADFAYPKSVANLPVILSVHGGRWIRGSRFDDGLEGRLNNGVINIRDWANQGFFAIRMDYRLVTCTPAPACFQDLACAVRWIHSQKTNYNIDCQNIFLLGQSAGGHMVSLAATKGFQCYPMNGGWNDFPQDFNAAISVAGAYDLESLAWGSGWCPSGVDWNIARFNDSPINFVSNSSKPILMFHSGEDLSVPIEQADKFEKVLIEKQADHRYIRYTKGGHLKVTDKIVSESLDFINSKLKK